MNKKKIVKEIFSECPMVRDYKFSVNEYGDFNFKTEKDGIQLLGIEGPVGLEQQLRMIVEKVKELHDKPFQEVISDLILLSAVYGSIYCEISGGEWKFDGVMVSVIKKRPPLSVSPLKEMIYTWKFPENQNITVSCALALHELVRWKNYFT